ncbi:DegT/DnrJ/EryC1/StrS family aminotransferase [Tranquillimonas rosea]|uniref:DegT/DnrJ/EryC1/StrS family aminotransferase n=1 Tax=Tranquillimonas rosea TaxID=641238 RepID=UPI003BABBFBE
MIPIAMPLLGETEADAARNAVLSGWVSQGPEVGRFETEFAAFVGADHACAVSNCTTALHLALLGVGVGPGDEVVTVSHSFIAGANAIRQCGAMPVFVDIEQSGFNIDPQAVAAALTPRTRAILCVHQIGMPCDMGALMTIANSFGLPVIEDAACGAGSEIRIDGAWQKIGRPIGDVVCFSFHPRKVITTGEGGMLTTNRADLDAGFRLRRQHGMSVSDTKRHASASVVFETYPVRGYNYRMTDIQAAIGRAQLQRLPEIVARRRELADRYHAATEAMPGLTPPVEPSWARSNWQSYCVSLARGVDQKKLMQRMLDRGVATRRGIMNVHLEGAYSGLDLTHALSRSEMARDRCILLPLYAQMTDEEQDKVLTVLQEAMSTLQTTPLRQKIKA